jgi:hypothetical protein
LTGRLRLQFADAPPVPITATHCGVRSDDEEGEDLPEGEENTQPMDDPFYLPDGGGALASCG